MNVKSKSYAVQFVAKDVPKPKTLDLRLAVTGRDLKREVKRAFDLARSAGRELNATFTPGAA